MGLLVEVGLAPMRLCRRQCWTWESFCDSRIRGHQKAKTSRPCSLGRRTLGGNWQRAKHPKRRIGMPLLFKSLTLRIGLLASRGHSARKAIRGLRRTPQWKLQWPWTSVHWPWQIRIREKATP